jgi:hypothetical protein
MCTSMCTVSLWLRAICIVGSAQCADRPVVSDQLVVAPLLCSLDTTMISIALLTHLHLVLVMLP